MAQIPLKKRVAQLLLMQAADNAQENKCVLSAPAFFTGADGCTVADGVWCTPALAFIQELQRKFPTPTFFTGTDGCIVADGVWCTPGLALVQEFEREFPTPAFFTSPDSITHEWALSGVSKYASGAIRNRITN